MRVKKMMKTMIEKKMRKIKTGFTFIELSLAMAIIGVLSIAVMLIISNAVSAYHKGLTLNQLNTVGMSLVEDIRVAIQASPARSVVDECATMYRDGSSEQIACSSDAAASFVMQVRKGRIKTVDGEELRGTAPFEGIFCTGKYTYIWNSGYLVNGGTVIGGSRAAALQLKYKSGEGEGITEPTARLLKVHDENRTICKTTAGYQEIDTRDNSEYVKASDDPLERYGRSIIDISGLTILDEAPEDLLEKNSGLAVYNLEVTPPATVKNLDMMFYAASMILGTLRGGPNIMVANDNCKTPEDGRGDFDYCAINKFNFAARAVGGANAF